MKEKTLFRWVSAFVFCIIGVFGTYLLQADEPLGSRSIGVRLPVTFKAPGKGFASLALYDKSGVLVRSLLYAEPVEKGKRIVQWDGTTDLGLPAKPGAYTARGIFFSAPPSLRYVMTVGKSGNPAY